ncbi:uncharacterized protein V1510DRAFT_135109 [Dipodascopsis tothii]|uniref:uncharacterized protein n=1 Tax=Dipodascopsis tothii TaxID=44089 RepID=UPI0034CEAD9D
MRGTGSDRALVALCARAWRPAGPGRAALARASVSRTLWPPRAPAAAGALRLLSSERGPHRPTAGVIDITPPGTVLGSAGDDGAGYAALEDAGLLKKVPVKLRETVLGVLRKVALLPPGSVLGKAKSRASLRATSKYRSAANEKRLRDVLEYIVSRKFKYTADPAVVKHIIGGDYEGGPAAAIPHTREMLERLRTQYGLPDRWAFYLTSETLRLEMLLLEPADDRYVLFIYELAGRSSSSSDKLQQLYQVLRGVRHALRHQFTGDVEALLAELRTHETAAVDNMAADALLLESARPAVYLEDPRTVLWGPGSYNAAHGRGAAGFVPEKTYAAFMDAFIKMRQPAAAFGVMDDMREDGNTLSVTLWNRVLNAATLVRPVMDEGVTVPDHLRGNFDKRRYRAHLHQRYIGELVDTVYGLMRESGVAPDETTVATLINGYFAAGRTDAALDLLFDVCERRTRPDSPLDGVPAGTVAPTVVMFNTAFKHLLRASRPAQSPSKLLAYMRDRAGLEADLVTCNTFLAAYAFRRDFAEAQRLLGYMSRNGIRPDVATYVSVLDALFKVVGSGPSRTPYSAPADDRLQGQVNDILVEMQAQGIELNSTAYNALMDGLAKSPTGVPLAALHKIYAAMRERGVEPTVATYSILLNAELDAAGDDNTSMANAAVLFDMIRPADLTVPLFNQMVRGLCRRGHVEAAVEYFDRLVELAATGSADARTPLAPNYYTYYFIIDEANMLSDQQQLSQRAFEAVARVVDHLHAHLPRDLWSSRLAEAVRRFSTRAR